MYNARPQKQVGRADCYRVVIKGDSDAPCDLTRRSQILPKTLNYKIIIGSNCLLYLHSLAGYPDTRMANPIAVDYMVERTIMLWENSQ